MSNLFNFGSFDTFLIRAVMLAVPALICITFHELAHGYTAYRLGDRTAKDMGRLTLNPIKHLDPIGLLMILIFRFGWAKPVPVNMYNFSNPRRYMAITAIAGPLSNIILAMFVMLIYGFVIAASGGISEEGAGAVIQEIILSTVYISIALAMFNLMPIPPLDGSKVLFSLLPDGLYTKLMRYERFGIILLIIVLNTPVFRSTIVKLTGTLFNSFFAVAEVSYSLVS